MNFYSEVITEQQPNDIYNQLLPYQSAILDDYCSWNYSLLNTFLRAQYWICDYQHIVSEKGFKSDEIMQFFLKSTILAENSSNSSVNLGISDIPSEHRCSSSMMGIRKNSQYFSHIYHQDNTESAQNDSEAVTNWKFMNQNMPEFVSNHSINLDVLQGHQYKIEVNPNARNEGNSLLYICDYENCGKVFHKTYNLVYHFRVHTKEKPFCCRICQKRFSQNGNLKKHMEIHQLTTLTERKIYKCESCSKSYTSIYNLNVSHQTSH